MSEWVSVDDKLPVDGQLCLIIMEVGSNIERGKYKGDGDWLGNWFNMRGKNQTYKVSHWMPLPNTPKD